MLGIVSLFTDAASEMIYPLIPVYISALGSGAIILGVIEGVAETTASLLKADKRNNIGQNREKKALCTYRVYNIFTDTTSYRIGYISLGDYYYQNVRPCRERNQDSSQGCTDSLLNR